MKFGYVAVTTMCLLGASLASSALAAFEPLFQITEITGECSVKRPADKDFEPAIEAKAYPYGTQVRTGARSTAVLVLSKGNTCRVLANALLTMQEGVQDPKLRQVFLSEGEVHVKLREDFHEDGSKFNVETAQAICGAIGCEFRVASQVQDELRVIIVRVIDGEIRVTGIFFNIDSLKSNDSLSLIAPMDNAFVRLKNMKGIYNVRLKEGDSGERSIETKEGMVLKVWQREVPETGELVVSVSITGPDDKLVETIVAVFSKEEVDASRQGGTGGGDVPTTTTTTRPPRGTGAFPTTTTVTSTTTTTTIKKTPTQVGLR
jgi:hypothetical protein